MRLPVLFAAAALLIHHPCRSRRLHEPDVHREYQQFISKYRNKLSQTVRSFTGNAEQCFAHTFWPCDF